MNICLLTCPAPFLIDEKVFPPLGLLAVGTALRAQGHEVRITNEPESSTCFGLGPTTPEYANALSILHQIKSRDAFTRVMIGGPHAIANPEECLADGFDVVAVGDGEKITAETFQASGVVDLGRGVLDEYPVSERSLLDIHAYQYTIGGWSATTIVTSRGCPYRCGFCANTERTVRFYGVDRIEREIIYLRNAWGYRALMIFDDVFILHAERARQICAVLKRHGIAWRCFVRGDLVVRHGHELIQTMVDSGCVEVAIGIESGSDRILRIIHKGEDTNTIRQAILMLRQAGIRVKGLFIVGLPGEDHASLQETRQFVEDVPLEDADFTVFQPYRGSPIWNNRQDYDLSWIDLATAKRFYKGRYGEYKTGVSTSCLTRQDILAARDNLEERFRWR